MKVYAWRFHVRSYEMDPLGQVSPINLLRYLEEGAVQASASEGYDRAWYQANNRMWVVRKMIARYYAPITLGDELELHTWVSDFRRVQSHREYALYRLSDGEPVVRARGNWVFLDTLTLQPQRLDPAIMERFEPTGELEDLDTTIVDPIVVEDGAIHDEDRRVQHYELDSAGHVNHANYLAWAGQALINQLRSIGWPPERYTNGDVVMYPVSDEIEYFRSALDHEPIHLTSKLAAIGRDRAAWHIEITHEATGDLIARDISVRAFSDAQGPRSIPDELYLALIQRPKL